MACLGLDLHNNTRLSLQLEDYDMDNERDGPSTIVLSTGPIFKIIFPQAHDKESVLPDTEASMQY